MTINLIVCLMMVLVLTVCIAVFIAAYKRLEEAYKELQASIRNLERLNGELRSQRHDYLNHLQVVYGLMELQEYEELEHYLQPVYKDMLKTGKALKTSKPALNALLKAKMDEAEGRGIDFYIEVKSDLKNLRIEDWELCKVLSNLFDNAMTAVSEREGDRRVTLDITEDKERYFFAVANNGPEIPASMRESIFKQGITSKKGEGHGMGLYIVSNVLRAYGGSIQLKSDDTETEFLVSFTKEESR